MPNFTERAIKESFVRLLNEKPLSQISVRMIAEDCGIHRNSFYYHYRDIPSLIEDIVKDEVGALIENIRRLRRWTNAHPSRLSLW